MQELKDALELMEVLKEKRDTNAIKYLSHYPEQIEYMNDVRRIVTLFGGNRCLTGNTEIYDPAAGKSRRIDSIKEPFHVESWDGTKIVAMPAMRPFRKQLTDIYRVTLSDGQYFDCSFGHQVLTSSGWHSIGSLQAGSGLSLPHSSLDSSQSIHVSDDLHYCQTVQDSQFGYHHGCHFCDGQPHEKQEAAQEIPPLLDGVREHNHTHDHAPSGGASPCKPSGVLGQPIFHGSRFCRNGLLLSIEGDQNQIGVQSFDSSRRSSCKILIPAWDLYPEGHLSFDESNHLLPPTCECVQGQRCSICAALDVAYSSVSLPTINIVRIDYLRKDYVWDFTVPVTANYIHAGVIHHNTGKSRTGSFETVCHLTGDYPDWWNGVRFKRPVKVWVVGESSIRVRDTIQEKLFGDIGRFGTGMIPKSAIESDDSKSGFDLLMKAGIPQAIDMARVKHKSGGFSTVQFFSYDQGRDKFQGSAIDWIWMDEEPPGPVYNECKMRILDTNGYLRFTFTPLGGVTELYDELMHNEKVGKHYLPMSSAKHLSEDAKEDLLSGYSASERQAREMGIATIGTGKVFQFKEEEYVCEDFEIPRHWRRIGGLDVGLDHPTCAVAIAIDDEASCVYIYKEYKKAEATPLMHTTHLRNWGLEFSTDPHAFDRAIGTGVSAAKIYEDDGHGLVLFKAPAGPGSVDASINKIRAWIGSGRFWIFKSCKELIEEFRLYRTDANGKIYKVKDDLVDACRYSFMSIDKATIDGRRKSNVDFTIEEWKPSSKYGY